MSTSRERDVIVAMRPKIMVLDEPTSMLDPISRRKIFDVLAWLEKEQNTTIIVPKIG